MTFEIPQLGDVPSHFSSGSVAPPLARVARSMAANGFMGAADLRIGGGGVRRLVEKPLERWWTERRLPAVRRTLPIRFYLMAGADWEGVPKGGRDEAWLVLDGDGGWTRCYLERITHGMAEVVPGFCEHLVATIYFAVDSVCYAFKPPDMLRLARAYWWHGRDDERHARALGYQVRSRRWFDNRVPRILQAPRYNRATVGRTPGFVQIKRSLLEVDQWMRDPRILRPNAHRLTGMQPGSFAMALRSKYGDPTFQLLHDHWHHVGDRGTCGFHGAWRVPTGKRAFARMLERIEATARLVRAIEDLLSITTYWSRGGFH